MLGKFIKHCEDSLTASVFTHLLHLPCEVFWSILRNGCCRDSLPENPGEPLIIDFWPSWSADGTENTNRVVPDLFIRYPKFDLIIEAKRWEKGMQYREQWGREVTAYGNEYGTQGFPVRMIALGGIWGTADEEVECNGVRCPVHMCTWAALVRESKRMQRELQQLRFPSSQTRAWERTLTHVIELLGWHGFSAGRWFSDFDFSKHRLAPSVESHSALFRSIQERFNKR